MITEAKKREAMKHLIDAQTILNNDEDADIDMLCCIGGLISDVCGMETKK